MLSRFQNYFKNRIGNIFKHRIVVGLVSRNLRFFTMFEKKESSDSATSLSSDIISSFSTSKICSVETVLSEGKGFTVFQKVLLSLTSFSFRLFQCVTSVQS